jgi:hypothetical protein
MILDKIVSFSKLKLYNWSGPKTSDIDWDSRICLIVDQTQSIQSTSGNRIIRFSNGHFSDTICVRFLNALAAILHLKT